jgi:hypothetical protein
MRRNPVLFEVFDAGRDQIYSLKNSALFVFKQADLSEQGSTIRKCRS